MKRLSCLLLAVLLCVFVSLPLNPRKADAVTGSQWRAGRIIDDDVFTNPNAMSVSSIQRFLNDQVPDCDTDGSEPSELGGGTRAQYGAARGNPAPFTCLKNYYEVPKTEPGNFTPKNNYGGEPIPSGAKSAARLIWDAAQRYDISPKVLLVTLQKESAGPLPTDEWPFKRQYMYAMGAHCPDGPNGAECDKDYRGFSLQMRESAELFRYYLDNMNKSWWPHKKPYQVNHILWNTTYTNCGGSNVYIENRATAALYTYTPYQPNAAALNNLYGTGDACSAYGNRNFWRIYNDWFGSTLSTRFRLIECGGSKYLIEPYIATKRLLTADGITALGLENAYFATGDGGCSYPTYAVPLDKLVRSRNSKKVYLLDLSSAYKVNDQNRANAWDLGDLNAELPQLNGSTLHTLNLHSSLPRVAESANTSKVYLINNGQIHEIVGAESQALVKGYASASMGTFSGDILSSLKNTNGLGTSINYAFRVGSQWYVFDHGMVRKIASTYFAERWDNIASLTGPALTADTPGVFKVGRTLGKGFQRSGRYYYVGYDGELYSTTSTGHAKIYGIEDSPVITSLLLNKLTD